MAQKNRLSLILSVLLIAVGLIWFIAGQFEHKEKVKNVIIISMDTCRADHLSCYGFHKKTTPNIDKFAEDAVLFTQAVTPVPITLPAHCTMLTGTIPPYHGVHHNPDYRLHESNVTLAEIAKQNGFNTAAIVSSFVLDSQFGLNQGFDYYNDKFEQELEGITIIEERRGSEASRMACQWLENNKDKPFFLFLHYFDPHFPYRAPEPFASQYPNDGYTAEVAYTDYCIGEVLKKLVDLDLYDSSLIIITADHGEATHGFFIYNSTIHVPLIIRAPNGPRSKKVDELIGLVDIVPTVCSLLNIVQPRIIHGKDLSGLFKTDEQIKSEKRFIYCESFGPAQYDCSPLLGLVSERWKYIQAPREELYDLVNDPKENNSITDKHPKRTKLMRDNLKLILQEQISNDPSKSKFDMDEQSKKRLESLGYVTGVEVDENFEFDDTKNDPKDWIRFHQQLIKINWLSKIKKYGYAESITKQVINEKPGNPVNLFLSGQICFNSNNFSEAIEYFSRFLNQFEDSDFKKNAEKLRYLDQYKGKALVFLGNASFNKGEYDQAIAYYRDILIQKPDVAGVYNNIGTAYLRQNKFKQALKNFEKALQLDKKLAEAYFNIGEVYFRMSKFYKAVKYYKKVIEINPHFNNAQNALKIATQQKVKLGKIVDALIKSLKDNPDQPKLCLELAGIFYSQDNLEESVYYLQKALQLKPQQPDVLNRLAWFKAVYKDENFYDPENAVKLAIQACEFTDYTDAVILDTLSAAYAATGNFVKAVKIAQKAVELAEQQDKQELAEEISEHISLYKRNQPYIDKLD